jgi:hypothetical protein
MVRSRHPVLAALAVLALGCATSGSKPAGERPRSDLKAADYYPLAVGWKWAYDLEKDGQKILAVYSVLERIGDTVIVQSGDERLTYAVTPEGIAQRDGGAIGDYVIKNPLAEGASWAVAGGTARIASTSQELTVAAGRFTGCVVVEVTRSDPARVARTTFAPEVGPVALELQVQEGDRFVTATRASLRAVTKPGEDLFK